MPDFGDHDPNRGRYEFQGQVNPADPSVANGQISPAQWAEYQAKRKRDAILGSLLTVGGMLGAQPLANALGVGATGAGSATSGGAGGGGAAGTTVTAAGMPKGFTPGWEGGTSIIGRSGAGNILGNLSARDLAALGLTAAGTVGGAMSNRNQNTQPTTATSDPNIAALMQMMQQRLQKSEPLYDSVLAMANGLLPTQYQKG